MACLVAACTTLAEAPAEQARLATETLSKTQTIYNAAACPGGQPMHALREAARRTAGFTDPSNHKQFVLNLAAHGVPRHADHAATSYIGIVKRRQGIEATDELIFSHFCSAVTEFSHFVSYIASKGEADMAPNGAGSGVADYTPAAGNTVAITRFDAVQCADPTVYETLEKAATNELYNPKTMLDPSGVHYLRSIMDSALLGLTTYADRVARRQDAVEDQFPVFCSTVKTASAALLLAQADYNAEVNSARADEARENQRLGLEAIKEEQIQEDAEKARRENYQDPADP